MYVDFENASLNVYTRMGFLHDGASDYASYSTRWIESYTIFHLGNVRPLLFLKNWLIFAVSNEKYQNYFNNYKAPESPIEFRGEWTKIIRGTIFSYLTWSRRNFFRFDLS